MELSWTTFLLEIVNFLVLVWILKRFLYKPVLDVVARRRAAVEKTLADANAVQASAEALKAQYENRLQEWDKEKTQAKEDLHKEMEEERARLLEKLTVELASEREKLRAIGEKHAQDVLRHQEETVLEHGAAFAARLLSRVTDRGLHEKLVELAIEDLAALSAERIQTLKSAYDSAPAPITVITAFDLADGTKSALENRFRELLGPDLKFNHVKDEGLKAGIRLVVGPWVLDANLGHELKAFAESAHGSA